MSRHPGLFFGRPDGPTASCVRTRSILSAGRGSSSVAAAVHCQEGHIVALELPHCTPWAAQWRWGKRRGANLGSWNHGSLPDKQRMPLCGTSCEGAPRGVRNSARVAPHREAGRTLPFCSSWLSAAAYAESIDGGTLESYTSRQAS